MRNTFAVRMWREWMGKTLLVIFLLLLFGIIILLLCLAAAAFQIAGYYQDRMESAQ